MNWEEIRAQSPDQWVIVEANEAFTDKNEMRRIVDFTFIEVCPDGKSAFNKYRELHNSNKMKEYYFLHTSNETVEIKEEKWMGIRIENSTHTTI